MTEKEQTLVRETVSILMPSIRPRSFKSLDTLAQRPSDKQDFQSYAEALAESLTTWRERTRGRGHFQVRVVTNDPARAGAWGVVRVIYVDGKTVSATVQAKVNDKAVFATLAELRNFGLKTILSGDSLSLVPDSYIWIEGSLYIVRPLSKRSWTTRQALRDAEHIVRTVQGRAFPKKQSEVT